MRTLEKEEAMYKCNVIRDENNLKTSMLPISLYPLHATNEWMYSAILQGGGGSGGAAGGLKFTVADTCERIKEEFNFIQQQYHSLKLECEKLASEKTEMQRHYVMIIALIKNVVNMIKYYLGILHDTYLTRRSKHRSTVMLWIRLGRYRVRKKLMEQKRNKISSNLTIDR
ncbi:Protein groucho [Vespula squamosa]|uniref:Protein groucho n=1 Tax=Vespula squamosa TaxID=30214 RepID=A0ABD1ZZS2_VESSQ